MLAPAGVTRADFNYSSFTSGNVGGLNLVGTTQATWVTVRDYNPAHYGWFQRDMLKLTDSAKNSTGAAWTKTKQLVSFGFDTTFESHLWRGSASSEDGDGLAFVLQNSSPTALGAGGPQLGYGGITNGVAVELDTTVQWQYPGDALAKGSSSSNHLDHVAVTSNGTGALDALNGRLVGFAGRGVDGLRSHDGSHNHVTTGDFIRVQYVPGEIKVYHDGTLVIHSTLELDRDLALDGGKAYVGFTAATPTSYPTYASEHAIAQWSFASTANPRPNIPSPDPAVTTLSNLPKLDFEGLTSVRSIFHIPQGYGGLIAANAGLFQPGQYHNGEHNPANISSGASGVFTVNEGQPITFTSATTEHFYVHGLNVAGLYRNDVVVRFEGWRDGVKVHTLDNFDADFGFSRWVELGFDDIDQLRIYASGGTLAPGGYAPWNSATVSIDDLTYITQGAYLQIIPEPASLTLAAAGLALLLGRPGRFRRNHSERTL